jgi:hypothetical protein
MVQNLPLSAMGRSRNRLGAIAHECESYALRNPFRFALLAVLVLLATSVAVLRIAYETNDDVFMTMIVSGKGFCSQPDEHLIFSNILVGRLLKCLYLAWPQFPWYGSYLLLAHYLAQVGVLYCALAIERKTIAGDADVAPADSPLRRSLRWRIAAYLLYFAVVGLVLLNNLQFTSTAFLAAQSGIFLLFLSARRRVQEPRAAVLGPLCAAVALLVLGGLIRLEGLGMACVVSAPLVVFLAWQCWPKVPTPSIVAAGVAGLLVLAAANHNRQAYETNSVWSWFYKYNQLRCKFNDYQWTSFAPETAHAFAATGWSKNDHDIMARWYFDDKDLYSEANLRSVLTSYPWKSARLNASYFATTFRKPLRDRAVLSVILALPFFLVFRIGTRPARWTILGCALVALLLFVVIGINNKMPPLRLYFPLFAFPLSAVLLFPVADPAVFNRKWSPRGFRGIVRHWTTQPRLTRALVTMLIVGTVMGMYKQCRRTVLNERRRAALESFIAQARSKPEKLYVCWEAALPFEAISPLDNLAAWSDVSILTLAWMQRTEWLEDVKRRFNISNLAKALCERDDIQLIATPTHRTLFAVFAKEHFGEDVEFVTSYEAGKVFVTGRFCRRALADATAEGRAAAPRR